MIRFYSQSEINSSDSKELTTPGFYFWSEDEVRAFGPYETFEAADCDLRIYMDALEHPGSGRPFYLQKMSKGFRNETNSRSSV